MLIAHLSDLHLRDAGDVAWLDRQLARIAARKPAHLAITGDLLDRWDPPLLERVLDLLATHGLLDPERLTLLHGNHDLASSGGHPRRNADLWRLAARFWDPPPVARRRLRMFHAAIDVRAQGLVRRAPWIKTLQGGLRIAVLDTVPFPWWPVRFHGHAVIVQHGVGCVTTSETEWLLQQRGETPLVVLVHHYPLPTQPFTWTPDWRDERLGILRRVVREVQVPMEIPAPQRDRFWTAAAAAGTRLVLCGHVHRARLERLRGIALGLNGQSGAEWAGRTIAFYEIAARSVEMQLEQVG